MYIVAICFKVLLLPPCLYFYFTYLYLWHPAPPSLPPLVTSSWNSTSKAALIDRCYKISQWRRANPPSLSLKPHCTTHTKYPRVVQYEKQLNRQRKHGARASAKAHQQNQLTREPCRFRAVATPSTSTFEHLDRTSHDKLPLEALLKRLRLTPRMRRAFFPLFLS